MKLKILLVALSAAAISSCSTAYKSGQTPDDVYYSPVRNVEEDSRVEAKKEPEKAYVYNDRQIRMATYDRRWRDFDDDYNCHYDPYHYGYNYGYYYNPYYYPSPVYISGVKFTNPKNTVPRMTNLGSYNYSNMVVVNPKTGSTRRIMSERPYNNRNNSDNFIRRIITPTDNSNNTNSNSTNTENNTRTYTPSSNNSSSNSSSGSSGTPVSRPKRGG
jgi:hypothetical protein